MFFIGIAVGLVLGIIICAIVSILHMVKIYTGRS